MELPFAVEPAPPDVQGNALHESDSSLVTASSQGSFIDSNVINTPLIPNTPQDVVLPRYDNQRLQDQTQQAQQRHPPPRISGPLSTDQDEPEVIDFTYVNVSETDADDVGVLLEGGEFDLQPETQRGDILTVLLSGMEQHGNEELLERTEQANTAATKAGEAKRAGDLLAALEHHTVSAKLYRDNALAIREQNASLANSLLLLSQTQAKSALALKSIVSLSEAELKQIFPPSKNKVRDQTSSTSGMSHKDRLRAAVRGALGSRHPHEADISDSQFLGRATSNPAESNPQMPNRTSKSDASKTDDDSTNDDRGTLLSDGQEAVQNPVDDMMELERELRDMDMALELGNSISSLDTRMNRMRSSVVDGSFMVVPPGSNSYMSTSMWGGNPIPNNPRTSGNGNTINTANVRARANRVSATASSNRQALNQQVAPAPSRGSTGLESSWWGNASTTSQVLTSSVISLGSRVSDGNVGDFQGQQTNTKQVMRLMDSLKTLGDENHALLQEVEEAEAARQEAKAAREEIRKFKEKYNQKFATLKGSLEKYMKEYPHVQSSNSHPVGTSEFHKNSSFTDQLQRQEQIIRKLTADLKKEKEESKKKDQALRKYENFYREVKHRSAQKAAQKTQQQRQHKAPRKPVTTNPR